VRQVTGILLIVYIAIIVFTTMLAKDIIDKQTFYTIQTTLDLPTAITLVVFVMLSAKLEFDKAKYRNLQRSANLDVILLMCGGLFVLVMIYLKYFL
jgi:hypothetical protein